MSDSSINHRFHHHLLRNNRQLRCQRPIFRYNNNNSSLLVSVKRCLPAEISTRINRQRCPRVSLNSHNNSKYHRNHALNSRLSVPLLTIAFLMERRSIRVVREGRQ